MSIVITNLENIEDAYALWRKCAIRLDKDDSPREVGYRRYYEINPKMFIAAYDKDRLVGVSVCFFDGRKASIYRIAVASGYRRTGIATKILERAEEISRDLGVSSIFCLIEDNNIASSGLFEKMSFRCFEGIRYYSKDLSSDAP